MSGRSKPGYEIEESTQLRNGEVLTRNLFHELSALSQKIIALSNSGYMATAYPTRLEFMVMGMRTMNTYLQQVMLICGLHLSAKTTKTTGPDPTIPEQLSLPFDYD